MYVLFVYSVRVIRAIHFYNNFNFINYILIRPRLHFQILQSLLNTKSKTNLNHTTAESS